MNRIALRRRSARAGRGQLEEQTLEARALGWGQPTQYDPVGHRCAGDGVVLRRLAPAEGAGLERLFFKLTTPGASTPSTQTDSIHPELGEATA